MCAITIDGSGSNTSTRSTVPVCARSTARATSSRARSRMNGSFCIVRWAATTVLMTRRMRPCRGSGIAEIITSSSASALVSMKEPTNFVTSWRPVETPAAVAM